MHALPRTAAMTGREWLLLFGLATLWGASFFFNAVAVAELPPLTLVFVRVALGGLLLTLLAPPRGGLRLWLGFALLGFVNSALPFSLIVFAQTELPSGLAAILNATAPLFGVLFASLFAVERATPRRLAGVATGFSGVVVMIGTSAFTGPGGSVLAECAVLGAASAYALGSLLGRRLLLGARPMQAAAGQIAAAAVLLAPVVLIVDRPWTLPMPGATAALAVLALAVFSTTVAYILYFRLLATAGPTNVLLVTFLVPVIAVLLGTALLDEQLLPRQVAGMALIALGLALIDGRLLGLRHLLPSMNGGRGR